MSRYQLFHCGIIWQRNYSFFQLSHHSTTKTLSFPFRFMIFFPFSPSFYFSILPPSLYPPKPLWSLPSIVFILLTVPTVSIVLVLLTALPQTPFYNSHYSTIGIVFPRKFQQTLQCYLYTTTEEFCLCRNNSLWGNLSRKVCGRLISLHKV